MSEVTEEKQTKFDVQETLGKAELFLDQNKKRLGIAAGIVLVLVGGVLAYKLWWLPKQDEEAQAQIFIAQQYFEKDSVNLALNGGTVGGITVTGLTEIADNYSGTKSANAAEYMIGVSLLRNGKFEEAIEHLSKFDSDDIILSSVALGAIGDANMELNRIDEAIKFYMKAADKNTNNFTTPIYLKRAALAYENQSNYAEAKKIYERLLKEFGKTNEGREAEKFIARENVLENQK
ncbi:MAG TPA: tetratricopeptide repeat protein [Nitrosopumilaceae archaeon]|nr:tetratricopeptide repeat protein [Nitrosopumilaceae archaeon]